MGDIQFKKILVPVDGSDESKRAFQPALYLAKLTNAQLTLLHVIDLNRRMSMLERSLSLGLSSKELKEPGYQLLAQYTEQVPEETVLDTIVQLGAPADVIVEQVEDGAYDLIVMGSRGLGALQDFVIGGVSHYVLHHSKVPVLVVR